MTDQFDPRALTARTLSEALPFLQRYDGATVLIKFGGHAMTSADALAGFARDVTLMSHVGVRPVVVHGGGPMIDEMLGRLGIETTFRDGRRVSDAETVKVAEMVLSGHINARIVQAIGREGGRAVGLSGIDAGLMLCDPAAPELGFVGRPTEVDTRVIAHLQTGGLIPVIAPIGGGRGGETYNVNADTAAGAVAAALHADRMLLLTDVAGVKDEGGVVISELSAARARELIRGGVVLGGMIPKVETALEAMAGGVRAVVILDGRAPNACLLELYTEGGAGTLIRG